MIQEENDNHIEVYLKRRVLWWDGEKICNVRKVSGSIKRMHLEVIDGQGYVVVPFTFLPYKYGYYSTEGLILPIKESVEWIANIKARQDLLSKEKKESLPSSEDKMNWILKKIRNLFQKTDKK